MIYFDYNASTPLCEASKKAIIECLEYYGNPSSIHSVGQASRKLVESARQAIANAIGFKAGDILFTSGATESINTVFHIDAFETILTSEIEHEASLKSIEKAQEKLSKNIALIPVLPSGIVDLSALETLLQQSKSPTLVSVMYVNNETGVIQPVEEIVKVCRQYDAYFHCDAVQAFGRFPFSFHELDFDYMSISAHKCGGPKGSGALIKKRDVAYNSYMHGGGQEMSMRGGTQNLIGIVGFGAAVTNAVEQLDNFAKIEALRTKIEDGILGYCPEAQIFGKEAQRVANTISLMMPAVASQTQLMRFDMADIAVSAGSACSAGVQKISHVLRSMNVPEEKASCAIRISLGLNSTESEANIFIEKWKEIYTQLSK